ncbi:MAG: hypothetical protein BAJATHORv1_40087 [Candidatus Thorarchaeota archaeon]|nr:MAG: hypothetical protein BAJATHORv1_40087 [Candidatus Thorarchaeota archaeon]
MTGTRRKGISDFRNVSDLRIQFYCEYRLYLKQIHGETKSEASLQGEMLHSQVSKTSMGFIPNTVVFALLVLIIIISAILWIWM